MPAKQLLYHGQPVDILAYTLRDGKRFALVRFPDQSEEWVLYAEIMIADAA